MGNCGEEFLRACSNIVNCTGSEKTRIGISHERCLVEAPNLGRDAKQLEVLFNITRDPCTAPDLSPFPHHCNKVDGPLEPFQGAYEVLSRQNVMIFTVPTGLEVEPEEASALCSVFHSMIPLPST